VSQGIRVNLISNGWTWKAPHVARAKEAGFSAAAFSLDGFENEHDDFRQAGSYERVIAAIDACVTGGLPVAINTTVNRLNQGILRKLAAFIKARGAFSWQVQLATPSGNMGAHRDLVIDPVDLLWIVPELAELCRANSPQFFVAPADDIGYYDKPEQDLRYGNGELPFWIGCHAGCQVVGIESNGNVKGCLSLPSSMHGESRFVEGNLREKTLAEIWNAPGAFAYNRGDAGSRLTGFCRVCRYREFCRGGCTWTVHCEKAAGGEGNPFCMHHQAVKHRRFDLMAEAPTAEELAFFGVAPPTESVGTEMESVATLVSRARRSLNGCRFDNARGLLEQALAQAPTDLQVLDLLGFVSYMQKDHSAGERYCRQALSTKPNHAYAHSGLGMHLARLGQWESAFQSIEQAISLSPQWAEPYRDFAILLGEAGRLDEAKRYLARGRQAIPEATKVFDQIEASFTPARS
jgi:radical SAM protein with 4Fe4S-binding SPASM domain